MKKLIVMLALALCCLLLTPALASASRPTLKSLAKSVAALQKKVNAQAKTLTSLSTKLTADETHAHARSRLAPREPDAALRASAGVPEVLAGPRRRGV